MNSSSRRFPLVAGVCVLVGSLLGGLLGSRVRAEGQKSADELWPFARVLTLIEDQYVGKIDRESLLEHAIEGMLRTLDPHSNYLNPESFSEMRDEQRGKFHGLGIQITKRGPDKPLTIIAPIEGTPAHRAGLQSGDIISMIEGNPTMDLTVQDAVRLLKGDKGTKVTITIKRSGLPETFDVTIERDEIPIESLRVAYMLKPGVGLIRIANFTTTTADELDVAIKKLEAEGMTDLILDLRSNPGGLLEQAVQVTERFIPAGKLVVYTRGRIPGANQDFVARGQETSLDLPLIVLVDRASASASEIVSGAIQDHDRGLVVGETTFGKGLVQRVIPVGDGAALAVTTAKYYTPSGRLIQRDYSDLEEYYLSRQDEEAPSGNELLDNVERPLADREVFHTASGRKVYGGGGITPDHIVTSPKPPVLLLRLIRENQIFDYAVTYIAAHPGLEKTFQISPESLEEFRGFLRARSVDFQDEEFITHRDDIALRLRAQIARIRWNQIEEARVTASADPQVQRALALFGEAAGLSHRARAGKPGRGDLNAQSTAGTPDAL